MIEVTEKNTIPLEEFNFLGWNKKSGCPFQDIKPFTEDYASNVWDEIGLYSPFNALKIENNLFNETDSFYVSDELFNSQPEVVQSWFESKLQPLDHYFFVSYQPEIAIAVEGKLFCQYWHEFYWPPGYAVTSESRTWYMYRDNDDIRIGTAAT